MRISLRWLVAAATVAALSGCATRAPYDYTAFKSADPKSIVVLPPRNSSPDVKATYGFYSHTQRPLAEAGFYVFPVALVDETFKNNGMSVVDEIHQVDPVRLQKIFGADAALYIDVKEYGTKYFIINSASVVTAEAKLVDLRTGALLWTGRATASSAEGEGNQGGLGAMLIGALVKQIMGSALDQSHQIAGVTSVRLLSPTVPNGILYGPRSPAYKSR